jgi:acyl carrier protein
MPDRDQIRAAVVEAILGVAADATADDLTEDGDLREELDIDSMDVLNIVTAVHDRVGVSIPETDYPKIATLRAFVDYVAERASG